MKVIITGSLGNVSKPLAEQLIQAGHVVTIISSNGKKLNDIEALGAVAAIGSLTDADFLSATFNHADAVYCMTPFDYSQQDQDTYFKTIIGSYIHAIQSSHVKKVVVLSGWAAGIVDTPGTKFNLDLLTDAAVAELRPGAFYTNFYGLIGTIKEHGLIMSNYGGDDRIAFVSPKDIASAAFEELTTVFHGNKVRYVASDELTCSEAAAILGQAIGKPGLRWVTISDDQMRTVYNGYGLPSVLTDYLVKMQAAMHDGSLFENYLQHRPQLGPNKFKDFAKGFASAFQGAQ